MRRFTDSLRLFWTSRTQTMRVPGRWTQRSTASSAKKCDLPELRPPCAALYRAGPSSGSKTSAVGILRTDKHALDKLYPQRVVFIPGQRLLGLSPSAIEQRRARGDTR